MLFILQVSSLSEQTLIGSPTQDIMGPPKLDNPELSTNGTDTDTGWGGGNPLESSAAPHQGIPTSAPQKANPTVAPPVASIYLVAESGTAGGAVEEGLVQILAGIKSLNIDCMSCLRRSSENNSVGEVSGEVVTTTVTGGEGEEHGGILFSFGTKDL